MYKNETIFLKILSKHMRNKEMSLNEISIATNINEDELLSEIDILCKNGYMSKRFTDTITVWENNQSKLISTKPIYRLTNYGKDVVSVKRDDWIKFWFPICLSIIAIVISTFAYLKAS